MFIQDILFKNFLQDDETIELIVHRHIIFLKRRSVKIITFGILAPFLMWWIFPQTLYVAIAWAWIGFMRMVYEWLDWYYDAWVITNISIIHVQWDGFFKKSAVRTEYHLIESIGYEINGFWATLLNYGTITVEKETGNTIVFEKASHPRKKTEQMLVFQDYFVTQRNLRTHKTLKGMLTDLLHHDSAKKSRK
jgi:hypothetical protein